MSSQHNLSFILACVMVSLGLCLGTIQGKPLALQLQLHRQEMLQPDPIDLCIVSCYSCYKGTTLVNCGNECIATDGSIGPAWTKICSSFRNRVPTKSFFGETLLH